MKAVLAIIILVLGTTTLSGTNVTTVSKGATNATVGHTGRTETPQEMTTSTSRRTTTLRGNVTEKEIEITSIVPAATIIKTASSIIVNSQVTEKDDVHPATGTTPKTKPKSHAGNTFLAVLISVICGILGILTVIIVYRQIQRNKT